MFLFQKAKAHRSLTRTKKALIIPKMCRLIKAFTGKTDYKSVFLMNYDMAHLSPFAGHVLFSSVHFGYWWP